MSNSPSPSTSSHLASAFDPLTFTVSHTHKKGERGEEWGSSQDFAPRGLRSFFEYRDLGTGKATGGKWGAHLIRKIPGAHGTTGPHMHSGLSFQCVLVLRDSISFEYKGHHEIVHYKPGTLGYQNPGIYHEEKSCGEELVLLEIISPQAFGTTDLTSSEALRTSHPAGGPRSENGDTFAVSYSSADGSDFVKKAEGQFRVLPIAKATNSRCEAHIARSASYSRPASPYRFFLQLEGTSKIKIGGETVEMKKGSSVTVVGKEVEVEGQQGEWFEMWENGNGAAGAGASKL